MNKAIGVVLAALLALNVSALAFDVRPARAGTIIINDPQYTWYGDFIVNASDAILIQNCNFTVEKGLIYVYGSLHIENSTVWMRHASYSTKPLAVYGNLTVSKSQILGRNNIKCMENSTVSIADSVTPTTRITILSGSINVSICDSVLSSITSYGGETFICNSTFLGVVAMLGSGPYVSITDSSVVSVILQQIFDNSPLEIRPGLVNDLTFHYTSTSSFVLVNSNVSHWNIWGGVGGITYVNSKIDVLEIEVDPAWSGILKLTSGQIGHLELDCSWQPITIENTTVDEFEVFITGTGWAEISDSENIGISLGDSVGLTVTNSTLTYLYPCLLFEEETVEYSGTILVLNSTLDEFDFDFHNDTLNLILNEGFHDFFNIRVPEHGTNISFVNSTIKSWQINTMKKTELNLSDSVMNENPGFASGYNLHIVSDSASFVNNSCLNTVFCSGNASLTITNSTINTLYAYAGANITAINSTINVLITDPIHATQINSRILLELDCSFEIPSEDTIVPTFSDDFSPPLPLDIQRHSQYLNVTTTYDDYLETQVRMPYNETQVQAAGVVETALRMYYLDQSGNWQLCPIQGVDTVNNCVWSNTTLAGKSYFVVGGQTGIPGDVDDNGMVDIFDAIIFAGAFGATPTSTNWNPNCDFNGDGIIDILDAIILSGNFGQGTG